MTLTVKAQLDTLNPHTNNHYLHQPGNGKKQVFSQAQSDEAYYLPGEKLGLHLSATSQASHWLAKNGGPSLFPKGITWTEPKRDKITIGNQTKNRTPLKDRQQICKK
jgi:hypothetical protein